MTFLNKSGIEILGHPPYSPSLAPIDFFLFPKVKDKLRGLSFNCSEDAVLSYERLISELPQDSWKYCYDDWFKRMEKCITCKGTYFEKQ